MSGIVPGFLCPLPMQLGIGNPASSVIISILLSASMFENHDYFRQENPAMARTQTFIDRDANGWTTIDFLPGVTLLPLAQPVKDGSIHRARLSSGTVIPIHTHPANEYVMGP